ncbi:hypothetical protein RM780_23395 [Streptomyces sp. DSM 44917]|uniref:Heavy metal-binding domain-containing protein n=1 Tax=Streptomyces boetiae TaxID=3075541 RepID=A0ABU2LE74_9ACTN|nr:hypothetical protein [Streptomyces sp. DSM 44917]MDT0309875.1 hypothetical protein [Streptomyces sp. DSM 44917]
MKTVTRAGAYSAGLAVAFGAAFGIGNAIDPVASDPPPAHGRHGGSAPPAAHEEDEPMNEHGGTEHDTTENAPATPGGLQISERGYTLVPPAEPVPAGERADFRFRVLGRDGAPLTRYEEAHGQDLHLIVVRRDLSRYQHVHPTLGEDGTWSVPLTFPDPGAYRVFADFTPAGDEDGALTLGADVSAAGPYEPEPLPEPDRTATVDGYTVTLEGDLAAGASSELTLSVSRDGEPVTDLQPYLGAYGHLVALRSGDLAYLHVHPQGEPGDGRTPAGPGITFHAEAPSAGAYRLYLDFRHEGRVRTAEFTVTAGEAEGGGHAGHGSGEGHAH